MSGSCSSAEAQSLVEIPKDCLCALTQDVMTDPVVCADGMSYERAFIEQWFARGHHTSPVTNSILTHRTLIPNDALRGVILDLTRRMPQIQLTQLKEQAKVLELEAILDAVAEDQATILHKTATSDEDSESGEERPQCGPLEMEIKRAHDVDAFSTNFSMVAQVLSAPLIKQRPTFKYMDQVEVREYGFAHIMHYTSSSRLLVRYKDCSTYEVDADLLTLKHDIRSDSMTLNHDMACKGKSKETTNKGKGKGNGKGKEKGTGKGKGKGQYTFRGSVCQGPVKSEVNVKSIHQWAEMLVGDGGSCFTVRLFGEALERVQQIDTHALLGHNVNIYRAFAQICTTPSGVFDNVQIWADGIHVPFFDPRKPAGNLNIGGVFNSVGLILPEESGLNLLVKVCEEKTRNLPPDNCLHTLVVGDPTGTVSMGLRPAEATMLQVHMVIEVIGARVEMINGFIWLVLSRRGFIRKHQGHAKISVKKDKDISAIEYELSYVKSGLATCLQAHML